MSTNDITGDAIRSGNRKENTKAIHDNWDLAFGKSKPTVEQLIEAGDPLKEIEQLRIENSMLAAGACLFDDGTGLIGDEGGAPYCAKDKLIAEMLSLMFDIRKDLELRADDDNVVNLSDFIWQRLKRATGDA